MLFKGIIDMSNFSASHKWISLAAAFTLFAFAGQASAGSDSCKSIFNPIKGYAECVAGPIQANTKKRFIYLTTGPFSSFWLRDTRLRNKVVASGYSRRGNQRTVWGLYSWYDLRVKSGVGVAVGNISNS